VARKEYWTEVQDHQDYLAAEDFLSFSQEPNDAREIVNRLRSAPIVYHHAANIFRIGGGPALPESNVHVVRVLDEFHKGKLLTPVLLVRGTGGGRFFFTIADGYFRICASIYLNEVAQIPCRMVPNSPPKPPPEPEPAKPTADAPPVDTLPGRVPRAPRIYG